jgi:tetratricopeptide (TPR) repeat protein
MRLIGDQRYVFIVALAASWLFLIGIPLGYSIIRGSAILGLPLLGVVLWFLLLRLARRVSPPVRADAKIRRGTFAAAVRLCDRALAVQGRYAWVGPRRLIWLNRRVTALLAMGRAGEALATALEAVMISIDPETLANCAAPLLMLNRYDEAELAARRALDLSRQRSVSAHATLAAIKLAKGMPAEAEALAQAGLTDIEGLLPLTHPEHHVACLAMLCRACRMQGQKEQEAEALATLRRVAGRKPALRAVALTQLADSITNSPSERDRAFAFLDQARRLASHYVLWYLEQPGTLQGLYEDPRLPLLVAAVKAPLLRERPVTAPSAADVQGALSAAQQQASARPAPQSSRGALVAQLLTLAATVVMLIWWAVRFYLPGT